MNNNIEQIKEFAALRLQTKPSLLDCNARRIVLQNGESVSAPVASVLYCCYIHTDGSTSSYTLDSLTFPLPLENAVGGTSGGGGGTTINIPEVDLTKFGFLLRDVNGQYYKVPIEEVEDLDSSLATRGLRDVTPNSDLSRGNFARDFFFDAIEALGNVEILYYELKKL